VPCSGECTTQLVDFNDFNASYGIWNDGGSDCTRSSAFAQYAVGGTGSAVRLRDNSSSSTLTTDNLNLSAYQDVTVDFSYITVSMDNPDEDFFLEVSTDGGSTFTIVEEWNLGDEFENEVRYFDAVSIPGPFSANTQFRFRCDASTNSDEVYLDDISISGCQNSARLSGSNPTPGFGGNTGFDTAEAHALSNFTLFPNPTQGQITLNFNLSQTSKVQLLITDTAGRLIRQEEMTLDQGLQQREVDASRFVPGIYFVHLITKGERVAKKFVVLK
jgi:hypothetical protein